MTRTDLIDVNKRIIHSTAEVIRTRAPEAIVIVVTNPLDEMTLEMFKMTQFPVKGFWAWRAHWIPRAFGMPWRERQVFTPGC